MKRRDAVKNMALAMGIAFSAPTMSALFSGCRTQTKDENQVKFSTDEADLIAEIADTIIPDTDTPGAKAAGVGPFIMMMLQDCYTNDDQKAFMDGLKNVKKLSDDQFHKSFINLSTSQKAEVLNELSDYKKKTQKEVELEKETDITDQRNVDVGIEKVKESARQREEKTSTPFFPIIRELTLLGYFTSEIGATQALAYVPIPGKYEACVDLKPGQKAWAM